MLRTPRPVDLTRHFQQLLAIGEGAPSLEEKFALSQMIRAESQDAGMQLDRFFVGELSRLQTALLHDMKVRLFVQLGVLLSPFDASAYAHPDA